MEFWPFWAKTDSTLFLKLENLPFEFYRSIYILEKYKELNEYIAPEITVIQLEIQ